MRQGFQSCADIVSSQITTSVLTAAAADQLCDAAIIIAICCRLPDFPLISWLFSSFFFLFSMNPSLPSYFPPDYRVCSRLLSEDTAVNAISDGGGGKPLAWGSAGFSALSQFFFIVVVGVKWRSEFDIQSVRDGDKRQNRPSSVCGGSSAIVSLWNSIRIQFHDTTVIKKNSKSSSGCLHSLSNTHSFHEYINNTASMNYSHLPAWMLVGVEAKQLWQETHTGKSNKGSNNLAGSAIALV